MFSSNSSQVSSAVSYIEDVFSTYLYTGNASSQTIANNIDVSTKGGLVWIKNRSTTASHYLFDTVRGNDYTLNTNSTSSQGSGWSASGFFNPGFLTNGFGIGSDSTLNGSGSTYASWTFREQPKFFDVVTYTGNGTTGRTINHSLASIPGCVIIKQLNASSEWLVWHQSDYFGAYYLNETYAKGNWLASSSGITDTTMRVDGGVGPMPGGVTFDTNASGQTYVAYLFAHNAGGFGLTGTDNVISCGSYTGTGSIGNTITVGYEPQWIMIKASSGTSAALQDWYIYDVMRGMPVGTAINDQRLMANLSSAEASYPEIGPTATGFVCEATGARLNESGTTYIYIAIRRGPMKVPTDATKVFLPSTYSGTGAVAQITNVPFPPDAFYSPGRGPSGSTDRGWFDRLRGKNNVLQTNSTGAEDPTYTNTVTAYNNNGVSLGGTYSFVNETGSNYIEYFFGRAPSFFDEVCYTGNSSSPRTISHNLGVVPEMIIVKARSDTSSWNTYHSAIGNAGYIVLEATYAALYASAGWNNLWNSTSPTSSVFTINTDQVNNNTVTYVAYLFATCAGVSKVGSYTGTGATQTISCGFTGGARFVLIKRYDLAGQTTPGNVGGWYVWDTARGMVSGTDPSLRLNSTAAEVNANSMYTATGGFQIVSTASEINASGGSYLYLAIA
jgi:hypothetical protein